MPWPSLRSMELCFSGVAELQLRQLVLDFQFLAFECRDVEIVVAGGGQFVLDLSVEVAVAPNERLHMAFGRHATSSAAVSNDSSSQNFHTMSIWQSRNTCPF